MVRSRPQTPGVTSEALALAMDVLLQSYETSVDFKGEAKPEQAVHVPNSGYIAQQSEH